MKFIIIFAIFTLIVTVQGAWWAAAAQPVILGLGAVLGTLNLDISDVKPITEWDYYVPTWTNLNKRNNNSTSTSTDTETGDQPESNRGE